MARIAVGPTLLHTAHQSACVTAALAADSPMTGNAVEYFSAFHSCVRVVSGQADEQREHIHNDSSVPVHPRMGQGRCDLLVHATAVLPGRAPYGWGRTATAD